MKSLNRVLSADIEHSISILLIDDQSTRALLLKQALEYCEYNIVSLMINTDYLVEQVEAHNPDLLVIGIDLPDSKMLQDLVELNVQMPRPIVMFAEKDSPKVIQLAIKAGVSAYIVDDIQPHRFKSIITVAMARFQENQQLKDELIHAKEQLAHRKLLERAKGLLMEEKGFTEAEAFERLRKMAMDKGQTLAQVSKSIIEVFELLTKV